MTTDYDRYYDTRRADRFSVFGAIPQVVVTQCEGRDSNSDADSSAPDPKSHTAPENLTRGAGAAVTTAAQRRTAPENAACTTTVTTTRALGLPLYVADPFTAQPARVGGVE